MKRLLTIFLICCLAGVAFPVEGYYYLPARGWCGDPMPFYDTRSELFRIYYLQEFRPNDPATYHPVYAVETTDMTHYTELGEVLPTGNRWAQDAAIGTGSVIWCEVQQKYYFFYTGNKYQPGPDDCKQAVLCATSTDGVNWTKTDFRLDGIPGYYYRNDFRDPEVFMGEDGLYHMLVATGKDGHNILAHFASADLQQWTDKGVFMNTLWDRYYECPNVFKMGDWWYLVYSELHREIRRVQYFKARSFEGLAACTANNTPLWPDNHEGYLDSRGLYAGKTASDGTNRYLWGWCPTRRDNNNTAVNNENGEPDWAGSLVAHRLIQHADGSLTLGEVKGIRNYHNSTTYSLDHTSLNAGQHINLPALGERTHLSFTLTTGNAGDKFGVSVCRDANIYLFYSLVVNPENDGLRKINFEQENGMGFIPYIDGYFFTQPADNAYRIDIYIDRSVLVMYINDIACYTNRIYGMQSHGWTINCYSGSAQITNLTQRVYDPNATGVEQGRVTSAAQKILSAGNLLICSEGRIYGPTGQQIRNK